MRTPRVVPYGQTPQHPAALLLAQRLSQAFDPAVWGRSHAPWSASFHLMGWIDQQVARESPSAAERAADWLAQHHAIDLPDEDGDTPLMGAIRNAPRAWQAVFVQRLLHQGADPARIAPRVGGAPATTPLILAVQFDAPDVVNQLLSAGAPVQPMTSSDPRALNALRTTALNEAVARGRVHLVERLLAAGAEINAPDAQRRTPLLLAVGATAPSLDVLDRLLNAGADVHARLLDGEPLPFVLAWGSPHAAQAQVIDRLLNAGYPVDARHPLSGDTLLGTLCNAAQVDRSSLDVLLRAGADPNATNVHGNVPAHFLGASHPDQAAVLKQLVDAGARLNIANHDGHTPMQFLRAELARWESDPARRTKTAQRDAQAAFLDHLDRLSERNELAQAMATVIGNGPSDTLPDAARPRL